MRGPTPSTLLRLGCLSPLTGFRYSPLGSSVLPRLLPLPFSHSFETQNSLCLLGPVRAPPQHDPGLCLHPCQYQGRASLLFSLESLFWQATLQQRAGSRGPQQRGRESRDDEQVPDHGQAQCGHGGLQAEGGLWHGQPGSAGSHVSQHRLQLEVGAQHGTDVEQLVAVAL